jgi:hypothetical protein
MKVIKLIILSLHVFVFQSCGENTITNQIKVPPSYKEILSISYGIIDLSLYITGYDSLTTGYNDIFFKVKKNSSQQTSGYVKFYPKMWMTPTYMHSTAVSERFDYDAGIGYYKDYVVFNMPTDPPNNVIWYGVFTYVDESNVNYTSDSTPMFVSYHREKQWRFIFDTTDQSVYMLSLLKPFSVVKGLNDFHILLHKTDNQLLYHQEINNAQMKLCVYELDSSNQSSGNINPTAGNDGIYRGKINLPYSGSWKVSDTIVYQGKIITNSPPPMPEFNFEIP